MMINNNDNNITIIIPGLHNNNYCIRWIHHTQYHIPFTPQVSNMQRNFLINGGVKTGQVIYVCALRTPLSHSQWSKCQDLVVRAKTGAGKTLSFLLPSMDRFSQKTALGLKWTQQTSADTWFDEFFGKEWWDPEKERIRHLLLKVSVWRNIPRIRTD